MYFPSKCNFRDFVKKNTRQMMGNIFHHGAKENVIFNIILLSFFVPAPCGISVSPRREHDFDRFAFSSGYLKSVEKSLKNIQNIDEKTIKNSD